MPLGVEVGLGPGHIVLDAYPAPPQPFPFPAPKRGHPQFLANACCGETAGWINMPLGMEVDLAPRQSVLYGDPAPPIVTTLPQFSAHVRYGRTAGWIKMLLGT